MNPIKHNIKHYYQPTNNTCGYAALATLLSHYDEQFKPEEFVRKVEQPKDAEGTSHGSVTAQLADWCQVNGYQVRIRYVYFRFVMGG
jgi:ABC-type bacteriocin/lantibiotic exporter with double-glycine peptidase domain